MVDLPGPSRNQESIVTSQAPQPQISGAEVAQPWQMLGTALDKAGESLEQVAKPLAEQAGLTAVTRDADGNLQINKAPIFGDAGAVYARAAKFSALAQGEGEAKRQDLLLSKQFHEDPQGYLNASQAFRDKLVQQYTAAGGPEVGISLGKSIDNATTYNYRWLLLEQQRNIKESFDKNTKATLGDTETDLTSLIATGGLDTAAGRAKAVELINKYHAVTNERISNPVSPAYGQNEDAAVQLKNFDERIGASKFEADLTKTLNDPNGGPYKARDMVDAQKDDQSLSPTQRMMNYVHGLATIQNWHTDQQRKLNMADLGQKAADRMFEDAVIRDTASDKPQINEYDVKTASGISPESKMRMLAWLKRDGMPEPMGRVDQTTAMDLFRRMFLPDGDPNKITNLDPVRDAYGKGLLKRETEDWLEKKFNTGVDPKNATLSKLETDVIKASGLDKSSLMKIDDTGKMNEYRYARYVDQRIKDYEDAKKDPHDLFNPSKGDFIGNPDIVRYFATPLQEQQKNIAARLSNTRPPVPPGLIVPGAGSAPPPAVAAPPRQPNETPAAYLRRIGQ